MLKNKVAVISGCNRGIGLSTLEAFSENGADIFACVRNIDDNFLKKIDVLKLNYGNKIFPVKFDLSNKDSIVSAINLINNYEKNLNIVVNNAGIIHNKLFQLTKLDEIYKTFEINFFNQIFFTQGLLRNIMKTKNGSIIFLSSSAAQDGNIGRSAYSSSKAALASFAKVLSRELGAQKIRVNTISPGLTETDMMIDSTAKEYLENIVKEIPLKRIANPADVSKLILYLSSDLSEYITGQDLRIDGGLK
jgi:3-oxoacyl-[acyl-carrier protein] reductase